MHLQPLRNLVLDRILQNLTNQKNQGQLPDLQWDHESLGVFHVHYQDRNHAPHPALDQFLDLNQVLQWADPGRHLQKVAAEVRVDHVPNLINMIARNTYAN